jgi:hypothetical protein
MVIQRRIYKVTKTFRAIGGRIFKPGETVSWDGVKNDPVTFEVDNIPFEADLQEFLASIQIVWVKFPGALPLNFFRSDRSNLTQCFMSSNSQELQRVSRATGS